ncbi:hypothetical protein V8E54_014465 [Elaphomyces granulatus]
MAFQTPYHEDSDADDEYERSVMASPQLPTDSELSPTDSEFLSPEHTPRTYGTSGDDQGSPRTIITEWTAEECADFVSGLGLRQYRTSFLENEIVGEALVSLKHDELKEMGITSVGHRLTILKSVYETKVKQDIPIEADHYIPLSADHSLNENATHEDIARIIQSIRSRDERLIAVEAELRRITEDYRRLKEELLPVFRMAKPLPYQPSSHSGPAPSPELYNHDAQSVSSLPSSNRQEGSVPGLIRSYSKRVFNGGSTPKNSSPTHIPPLINEGRSYNDSNTLDPSAAAVAASSHLTASMNGGAQTSPGIPSPTSPNQYPQQTLASRSYTRESSSTTSNRHDHAEEAPSVQSRLDRPQTAQSLRPEPPASRIESRPGPTESAPSVEIFKSFRVSMDDPCYKVLPAALKKYNINADWRHYALYIVYGDQERCLGLDERPLILFKQLDKEGRKPMFMLRKNTPAADGSNPNLYPGSIGSAPNSASFDGKPTQSQVQVPGGVL